MPTQDESQEIIAHRGFSARAPENTLAAMEAAIHAGADALEWDVQVASCGTPVLFHDSDLERTSSGRGPLRERTLEELRLLDAGSWFSADFAGEPIPTLEEAFERVRGRVGRVYCELKAHREPRDLDRIVAIAEGAQMLDDTVFISSDWSALERVAAQRSGVRVGYIVDRREHFEDALERAAVRREAILDFDRRLLLEEPALVARTLARGVGVATWTVNDTTEAAALVDAGVSCLTTDQVERFVAWRASRSASVSALPPA